MENNINLILFTHALRHVLFYEGFSDTVYTLNGQKLFGFGSSADIYTPPKEITVNNSVVLTSNIINRDILQLQEEYPFLEYHQYLALSLLAYRTGITKLRNSDVFKDIVQNRDPYEQWIKWKYYTVSGSLVENPKMLARCEFEYQLFSGEFAKIFADSNKFNLYLRV